MRYSARSRPSPRCKPRRCRWHAAFCSSRHPKKAAASTSPPTCRRWAMLWAILPWSCAWMPSAATTSSSGAPPRCGEISSARFVCECSMRACIRGWARASRPPLSALSNNSWRAWRARSAATFSWRSCRPPSRKTAGRRSRRPPRCWAVRLPEKSRCRAACNRSRTIRWSCSSTRRGAPPWRSPAPTACRASCQPATCCYRSCPSSCRCACRRQSNRRLPARRFARRSSPIRRTAPR